jgi:hypothetical protein
MAQNINDSYTRCICELRARYKGRGIANSIGASESAQERIADNAQAANESYVLFDSRTNIADSYRSGVYNGSKYMTSDDFVRYFKTRRAFYMPEAVRAKQQAEEAAVVAPQRKTFGRGRRESGKQDSKEGHLSGLISAAKEIVKEWLPMEAGEFKLQWKLTRLPTAAMSALAVFTISLGLIVGGSVMIGNASGELGGLNSEIASLEETQTELESKLSMKYDINQLKNEVEDMGMIKMGHADNQYITIDSDCDVIVYDKEDKETTPLMALLSAFGFKLDN